MSESLEQWLAREYAYAARALLRSVSPVALVKQRPGFGQSIRPVRGAVVASPVLASYDPDPDYFFHWFRDSAVVLDALRLLYADGTLGEEAPRHCADFVRFSLALRELDGRLLAGDSSVWRKHVAPEFVRYLRDDAELARVHGDAVAAEARVNPDGTLDISRWTRPQHDGPPLRALTLLRWLDIGDLDAGTCAASADLLRADLAFTQRHWDKPSFDLWEEELGLHYYTLRVSAAALEAGASWLQAQGESEPAQRCREQAQAILRRLDAFWLEDESHYGSRLPTARPQTPERLDIAVILAVNHADEAATARGPHSVSDPRVQATLARLQTWFDTAYVLNRARPPQRGVALGRYAGDVYYGGSPGYVATLGAAEFCFRAAAGARDARSWSERGDAFLRAVQTYTPPGGELSEQFDRDCGAQISAKHLAWSYAAFISCFAARRRLR